MWLNEHISELHKAQQPFLSQTQHSQSRGIYLHIFKEIHEKIIADYFSSKIRKKLAYPMTAILFNFELEVAAITTRPPPKKYFK